MGCQRRRARFRLGGADTVVGMVARKAMPGW